MRDELKTLVDGEIKKVRGQCEKLDTYKAVVGVEGDPRTLVSWAIACLALRPGNVMAVAVCPEHTVAAGRDRVKIFETCTAAREVFGGNLIEGRTNARGRAYDVRGMFERGSTSETSTAIFPNYGINESYLVQRGQIDQWWAVLNTAANAFGKDLAINMSLQMSDWMSLDIDQCRDILAAWGVKHLDSEMATWPKTPILTRVEMGG